MLQLTLERSTGILHALAELIGGQVEPGNKLRIPPARGSGYLQGFLLGNSLRMMIRNFELNEDLLTRRAGSQEADDRILVSFNNVFPYKTSGRTSSRMDELPSIHIGKGNMNLEMFYPSKTNFRSILLAIDAQPLRELLGTADDNPFLKKIMDSHDSLLFEEVLSPDIQKVALELIENRIPESLHQFYFRIKAEELLCLLFAELYKRESTSVQALNEHDVVILFRIRDKIISAPEVPPVLNELAIEAGMSESKLRRLFKQIFGSSIFNYYQKFRMQEAARLLKEHKLTVTEVGSQLGFRNLSHFTRVFEEHMGMKPKRYSAS